MNYASHLNVRTIQSIHFQGTLPSTKLRLDLVPIVNKEALSLTIARCPKSAAFSCITYSNGMGNVLY